MGRAGFILDNPIAAKKARPMIVVMPAGHSSRSGANPIGRSATEDFVNDFVKDVKPCIESHYRVMKGRANTAIAGLSMGGGQTLNVAIPHLDQTEGLMKRTISIGMLTVALASAGVAAVQATKTALAASQAAAPAAKTSAAAKTAGGAQAKIEALVAQMTLDEKISMLHGTNDPNSYGQAGYIPGVPRLGIPPLRLADGPAGLRTAQPATALPAPIAMASTFSPALAKQYGQIIGRDARARHQNVVLAPMVNIIRVPQAGRNFETLGEDPLLASRLVAAEIEGIQREGTIATVKHYAFNNQENQRRSVSAEVDEQTGRETELPAFEAAVRAGVGSVMAAYNKVNGAWAAESVPLLTDILRKEWGFKGFVMSDWSATHSGAPALTAGMEMEMPNGRYYGKLAEAVKSGELKESVVNEAVRRILSAMEAAGLLKDGDATRAVAEIPATSPGARDIVVAGAVLLKNERNVLPLGKDDLASLAVIGPTAKVLVVGGGGSANVRPMHNGNPLEILQQRAGAGAKIAYAKGYDVDGEPVPSDVLRPEGRPDARGLLRKGAAGAADSVDAAINFVGPNALPAGSSVTWTGAIIARQTGDYVLKLQTAGGRGNLSAGTQGARQGGPGQRGAAGAPGTRGGTAPGTALPEGMAPGAIAEATAIPGFGAAALLPTADGLTNTSTPTRLEAGVAVPLTITVTSRSTTPVQVRLTWVTPDTEKARIDEAAAAARAAKTAVVFAYDEGTEGRDRASLSMPGPQDALIAAVAAANPRTVVVLNNGAPITMPWADKVAGILQMWYPGQEGADATAAILLGEASPGGRLPVTFPRRAEDAPTAPAERYPGVNGKGAYSEGIFIGYRWYDKQNIEPLFPFGHGLSYTTFSYSALTVRPAGDGFDVSFTVKNTGTRPGVDVPQVYVGPAPNASAPMAVKKLVGFDRVTLAAGQAKPVTIHVDARGLSYWSVTAHKWIVAPGPRAFMVGASSRSITLKADVVVGEIR